jgi:hypothetical protein
MCGNLATTRLVRSKHVVIIVINCIARTCFAAAFENSIICVNQSRIIYIEKNPAMEVTPVTIKTTELN